MMLNIIASDVNIRGGELATPQIEASDHPDWSNGQSLELAPTMTG
jgi:hypothetical protein